MIKRRVKIDKIKRVPHREGIKAYCIMYKWFTDVSGLGLAEQARKLMHPDPPRREDELAEYVEQWQDKMKRLEGHGNEYKLARVQDQRFEDADGRKSKGIF